MQENYVYAVYDEYENIQVFSIIDNKYIIY